MNRLLVASAALFAIILPAPVFADTLRQALLSTYRTNPTLNAQREVLRGTDAGVAVARAGGRPTLGAQVGLNRDLTRSGILITEAGKGPRLNGGVDLSLPLFQGGRVRNSILAAQTRVEAGRATLRAIEGDVFAEAVAGYMDVIRDRAIVKFNENQSRVLTTNLQATRDLYESGELTLTDVAQSEARLSLADSQLARAQARLSASEETYHRVIGQRPGRLAEPPALMPLPATEDQAVRIALAENPDIIATVRQAQAAGLDVRVVRADRLPTLSGVVSGNYVNALGGGTGANFGTGVPNSRTGTQASIGLTTRIPLYQGGLPSARIRQAQAQEAQLLEQAVGTERAVVANIRAFFASYEAGQRAIQFNQVAVSANELALEGARAERVVGTRTVLDVLNAEQELLSSRLALVSAQRDAYVAGFELLNAMGQAQAKDLGLDGGPLYDPTSNYRRVNRSWNDWAGERRRGPTSTRTSAIASLPLPDRRATQADTTEELAAVARSRLGKLAPVAHLGGLVGVQAEVPAPADKGRWQIQLGAFELVGAPQALYERLSSQLEGKQATYRQFGRLTRLLVGTYGSKGEALAACRTLGGKQPCYPVLSD